MKRRTTALLAAQAAFMLMAVGCGDATEEKAEQVNVLPQANVRLVIEVAGDEELAEAMRRVRGEWKAHTGGELEVRSVALDDLHAASPTGDLVAFPSRLLGALVERGDLRPLRAAVLASERFGLNDIYPAIRNVEMKYGGQVFAAPLGSPPLLACYATRNGADGNAGTRLPETWSEFRRWAGAEQDGPRDAAIPLAGRAAAFALLARGLSYTEPSLRNEALFDPESMAPRIGEPPFVRALAEMRDEAPAVSETAAVDFAGALELLRTGRAAVALGWPSLAIRQSEGASSDIRFAPLPRAEAIYSRTRKRWENQADDGNVVLLGVEGRLLAVTAASRNAVSAFKLAEWIASGEVGVQVSSASHCTLWFRASQARSAARWGAVAEAADSAAEGPSVAGDIAALLESDFAVAVPRIPGIDEYLDALAAGMQAAEPGESGALAALARVKEEWQEINERHGIAQQLTAYRRHLGVEEIDVR